MFEKKKKQKRKQTFLDVRRIDYPQKDKMVKEVKNTDGSLVRMAGNAKILLYNKKKQTIMNIKNLYSFFTKLQTRIMNKTNIYPIHKKKTIENTKQLTVKVFFVGKPMRTYCCSTNLPRGV